MTNVFAALLALSPILLLVRGDIPDLSNLELPDLDDIAVIREKCDERGGKGTYEKVKASKIQVQSCFEGFADPETLKNEVEEAKKTGSMDEVFGKYCNKRPQVQTCVQNFTETIKPCLSADEKSALNITLTILKQLGEFICFRDGDRIAMFVAEGGVECIKDHTEGIKTCVTSTLKIDTGNISANSLPSLLIDAKKCNDLGKLQECVVTELEKCKDSTPANIVDALFRFIKRSACTDKHKRSVHSLWRRGVDSSGNLMNSSVVFEHYGKLFEKKCQENAPSNKDSFKTLKASAIESYNCFVIRADQQRYFLDEVSEIKANLFDACMDETIEKAELCLAENEKYFPKFYKTMLINMLDFTYENKHDVKRLQTKLEFMSCTQTFKNEVIKNEYNTCIQPYQDLTSTDLTKSMVCERLVNMSECTSKHFNKYCSKEKTLTKLKNSLFEKILSSCREKETVEK